MTDDQYIDDADDLGPPTSEDEAWARRRQENHAFLEQLNERGWCGRAPGDIVHPTDSDLAVFYNPLTEELLLTPKLVDLAKALFRKERGDTSESVANTVFMEFVLRALDERRASDRVDRRRQP